MAFLKIDEEAARVFANALPETSVLRVRLSTMLDMFPHLPDDAVVELSTNGAGEIEPPAVVSPPEGVPQAEHDAVDPWPAGGPKMVNPPFGWRRHGKKAVRAKEEQEILRRVLQGKKRGWSNSQIAEDLNGRHLRTRRGSKWDGGGINRLWKGPVNHAMNAKVKERYG